MSKSLVKFMILFSRFLSKIVEQTPSTRRLRRDLTKTLNEIYFSRFLCKIFEQTPSTRRLRRDLTKTLNEIY